MQRPDVNRRGARRYALEVAARVGDAEARTRDMSSRGLYLLMPKDLELGATLDIDLALPDGAPGGPLQLKLRARVVRLDDLEEGMGVATEIESWTVPESMLGEETDREPPEATI